jgi:hypothetical protein
MDFLWFCWILLDFHGFSKIQVDFVSFKQFPKDSEQPACRDDDLRVDFYWFSSSFPWIFCDSVGFSKIFKWIFNVSLSPCRLQNKANRTRFRPHNADRNAHRGCKNSGIYNRFAFAIKTLCLLVPGGHTRVWHSNLSASLRESWPPPLKSGRGGGAKIREAKRSNLSAIP